jgi:hypothetical protein
LTVEVDVQERLAHQAVAARCDVDRRVLVHQTIEPGRSRALFTSLRTSCPSA